jgi:hypothetical protein
MENAFGSSKNKWRTMKHFNFKVDKHHQLQLLVV